MVGFETCQKVFMRFHSSGKEIILEGKVFKRTSPCHYTVKWNNAEGKSFPNHSIHESHLSSDRASCIEAAINSIKKLQDVLKESSDWKDFGEAIVVDQIAQLEKLRG